MSISYWLDQSASSKKNYDVVVVGGGISGLSSAYWLHKKDPQLKIAIIDKGHLSSGATGRNAGFITCGSVEHFNRLNERWGAQLAKEIWQFSEDNLDLLKSELNLGDKEDFQTKGSFSLASTENEFLELKKSAQLMEDFNIQVESLDEKQIQSRLNADGFVGGIKYLSDASIHPRKLCETLLASMPNVDFFPNTELFKISSSGDQRILFTNQHEFHCQFVVLATNGYLPLINPYFEDLVSATRGQILITEKLPLFLEGPCYANFVLDYFRQLPSGELIIGGFRQLEKDTEVGYSDHTSKVIQNALEKFINTHLPAAQNKSITHRWSGVMGFSFDGQPFIGVLPSDPQIFFLGGFTAHGLGLAFHTGKCLSQLIFGEEFPEFISAKRK
ncbi:MAG: FAD-binding oxidoreductase [Bdellovibrionaceae bacterium]|jgi:glycine/D-amino acid oxidase-like deaminating enzyme|nr:FAD-binding oxidoreductase [Pseudobdellovibrionaceae bacterium]